jgi:hypothetical protein
VFAAAFNSSFARVHAKEEGEFSGGFGPIGHNVKAFSPCSSKIAEDFIANLAQSPDTSCAGRAAAIRFLPKQETP